MVQVSIIRLIGYREWTESLGFDREHVIQEVQGNLHRELSRIFSQYGAFAHPLRYDYMIAITNGMSVEDHKEVVKYLKRISPVPIAIGIACDETPLIAEKKASQLAISAKPWEVVKQNSECNCKFVTIAHADIVNSTSLTISKSSYEVYSYVELMYRRFKKLSVRMGGLTLYLGGDNMLSILGNNVDIKSLRMFSKKYCVRIGIGISINARKALTLAAKALHEMRSRNLIDVLVIND